MAQRISNYSINDRNLEAMMVAMGRGRRGFIQVSFGTVSSNTVIKAGSVVEINNTLYEFTTDEQPTGSGSYIKLVPNGDGSLASPVLTDTEPVWRDDLQGWYTSGTTERYINKKRRVIVSLSGSGTFTVPQHVYSLDVQVQGGGGGSGRASLDYYGDNYYYPTAGGGGGAGGYARSILTVIPGQSFSFSVGGVGGQSIFGAVIGNGGASGGNAGSGNNGASGTGGSASGQIAIPGQAGGAGRNDGGYGFANGGGGGKGIIGGSGADGASVGIANPGNSPTYVYRNENGQPGVIIVTYEVLSA